MIGLSIVVVNDKSRLDSLVVQHLRHRGFQDVIRLQAGSHLADTVRGYDKDRHYIVLCEGNSGSNCINRSIISMLDAILTIKTTGLAKSITAGKPTLTLMSLKV